MRALHVVATVTWLWVAGLTWLALVGVDVRRHNFESAGLSFGVALLAAAWAHFRRPSPVGDDRLRPHVIFVAAAVAGLAYGWSLWLGPLSDDFILRQWAVAGDWLPDTWGYTRPVPLAFWQLASAAGSGWIGLHALNVAGHAANAAMVAWLADRWNGTRAALGAGLLFAMFPASAEAVAWAAGVFDVSATFFVLTAVVVGTGGRATWPRAAGVGLATVLGLLCKETAIATPFILALVVIRMRDLRVSARLGGVTASAAACVVYLALRGLSSPTLASHLSNMPSGRRQWKDLLVRPFAGVGVPLRTDMGVDSTAEWAGLLVLIALGAAMVAVAREPKHTSARGVSGGVWAGMGWVGLAAAPLLLSFYVAPNL